MFLEILVISVLLSGYQVTPSDKVNVTVTHAETSQAMSISFDPPILVNKNPEAVGEAPAALVKKTGETNRASDKVADPNTDSYPVVTKEEAPAEQIVQMEEAPAVRSYPAYPWEQKYGGKGGDISGLPIYHPLLAFKTSSKSSRVEEKDPFTGKVMNPSKSSHSKGWFHQAQLINQPSFRIPGKNSEEESK